MAFEPGALLVLQLGAANDAAGALDRDAVSRARRARTSGPACMLAEVLLYNSHRWGTYVV